MPDVTTPYTDAQRRLAEAIDQHREVRKRHEAELEQADRVVQEAREVLEHLRAGTDPETKALAETVIDVYRPGNVRREDGPAAVRDAILDLLAGGGELADRPRGTKSYSGWVGQRCDGAGSPKHGTIVFRISLTDAARDRLKGGGELTPEEIEAAVTYLTNLDRIEAPA